MTYRVRLNRSAARTLADGLPESMAVAVAEFIYGPLAENPYLVGKPLRAPFEGSHAARRGGYRIIYQIDDAQTVVAVIRINHRRDAYHR